MKDNNHVLTLQETEELCRLYLECRLSILEEKELQYVLGMMTEYSSPVIDEARESMAAEGLLCTRRGTGRKGRLKPGFRWLRIFSGVAASIAVVFALSVVIKDNATGAATSDMMLSETSRESVSIAYEGGRRLSPKDAEQAIEESMRRADELLAMAEAKDREEMNKIESLMQLTHEKL